MIQKTARQALAVGARLPAILRWAAAVLWVSLLWHVSGRPSDGGRATFGGTFLWNGAHVVCWFVLGTLLFLALADAVPLPRRRAVWAAAIGALYGVFDELRQSTVPGRDASLFDVSSDALGALLAVMTILWVLGEARPRWIVALVPCCFLSVGLATWVA